MKSDIFPKMPTGFPPQNQPRPQQISIPPQVISAIAETVFVTIKGYIDEKFTQFSSFLEEIEDCKINLSTLLEILIKKEILSKKEFFNKYPEICDSFGKVNLDGTLEGTIIATKYNFSSEK